MRGAGWKCYSCGTGINSLAGEIHHKDGDHQNNTFLTYGLSARNVTKDSQRHREIDEPGIVGFS